MPTSREDISEWFDKGLTENAKYMVVVCDTFDGECYPAYENTDKDCLYRTRNPGDMQQVMEVYNLMDDKTKQINEYRTMRIPRGELE
jgi:hypothetical protein